MSDVGDLWKKYNEIMSKVDPERVPKVAFMAFGHPAEVTEVSPVATSVSSATFVNWSDAAAKYAIQLGKEDEAKQLTALKQEAADTTQPENITSEISNFYSSAFDLTNAQMSLEAVANLSERNIDKGSKMMIESYLDKFGSLTEKVVTTSHGMFTDALKGLKEKIAELKQLITGFGSKIKDKVLDAFNNVLEFFFKVISEFVSRMFSFVSDVSKIAETKGYTLKSVNISFDPPSFGKVTVLGVPIPFPKFSLPKVEVGFEVK